MQTVADSIRMLIGNIEPGNFDPAIHFETKSHYGREPMVYVTSHHKDALAALTGTKTLTQRHIEALKALGFIFHDTVNRKQL